MFGKSTVLYNRVKWMKEELFDATVKPPVMYPKSHFRKSKVYLSIKIIFFCVKMYSSLKNY